MVRAGLEALRNLLAVKEGSATAEQKDMVRKEKEGGAAGGYGRPGGPTAGQVSGWAVGGVNSSRANPASNYYAMVCSRCPGRHWFSTVHTNLQVTCP